MYLCCSDSPYLNIYIYSVYTNKCASHFFRNRFFDLKDRTKIFKGFVNRGGAQILQNWGFHDLIIERKVETEFRN